MALEAVNNVQDLICRDEGFKSRGYVDSVGVITWGHGLTWITSDESRTIVGHRIDSISPDIDKLALSFGDQFTPPRRAVLISVAYIVGINGLLQFHKMLSWCAEQNWENAATELLASKLAGQDGDRIKRLAEQLKSGNWV